MCDSRTQLRDKSAAARRRQVDRCVVDSNSADCRHSRASPWPRLEAQQLFRSGAMVRHNADRHAHVGADGDVIGRTPSVRASASMQATRLRPGGGEDYPAVSTTAKKFVSPVRASQSSGRYRLRQRLAMRRSSSSPTGLPRESLISPSWSTSSSTSPSRDRDARPLRVASTDAAVVRWRADGSAARELVGHRVLVGSLCHCADIAEGDGAIGRRPRSTSQRRADRSRSP